MKASVRCLYKLWLERLKKMMNNTQSLDQTYIANTYARFPVTIVRGEGVTVYDEEGKKYIDLGSGIAVNSFGVNDPIWKEAIVAQLNQVQHTSNLYYTLPQITLAKMLCEKSGMKRVFFSNSGAESNECAIKVARKYASDQYGEEKRPKIVTLLNSFHGRTITTLSATGQDVFHHSFGPFTPGFVYAPANDFAAMEALLKQDDVCAVMLELVQGEGGVLTLDKEYVQKVAALCKEKDVLLLIDEVQTGNGRTGTLYAFQQFDILPDVVSTAKGLAGGLPMGATLLGEKVKDTLNSGSHGSTFGGNPICAAAAVSVISRIDDAFLAQVKEKSQKIIETLSPLAHVKSISGMGLMLGIECDRPALEVVNACIAKGVIPLTAKNKVRLLPALNISWEELDEALQILSEILG